MRSLSTLALVGLLVTPAVAQEFDNQWKTFFASPSSLSAPIISSPNLETDMDWADLDKDGWIDLVIVRKQPFTSAGKRTNMLLMNENGVLTDRTSEFASASDLGGDQGFLTATNDRDVVIADLDGDTWLDVATATTISDGDPKALGHPRIYMNLGEDGNGDWLGLEHQDARIPQLIQYASGLPQNPRFCSVDAGDIDGDGDIDLYFGDYDSSGAGGSGQPPNLDMNDRLLVNDGFGFFTDESQARMTDQMLLSAFSAAVSIADMNGDGFLDVVKQTALQAPQYVCISYNNLNGLAGHGNFNSFDNNGVGSGAPYHIDTGDLNNDGKLDIITSDDGQDRYRLQIGLDALGRAEFAGGSGGTPYQFLSGNDDGFASNNRIVDLNGDGWADTIHADIDVDIPGGQRRMHIYHNTAPEVGAQPGDAVVLREERQQPGNGGWIGAKGLLEADLKNTHDFATFDINNDGAMDILISRVDTTEVYLGSAPVCQTDLGFGDGNVELAICGDDLSFDGSTAVMSITGGAPNSAVLLPVGLVNNPTPVAGGTLVPVPTLFILTVLVTDANGNIELGVTGGGSPAALLYVQAIVLDGGFDFSNALEVQAGHN